MSGPAQAPALRGYTHRALLGSGGFADVFLYEQHMPKRRVAVKVLRSNVLSDAIRRQFDAEANLMAELSAHPYIVTIHHADVADDGRPYLVMEYCPGDNLSIRSRSTRIPVAEALRVGVRISSAVETAHRAGILHRDIKPANILTTHYGWPALTDFGLSVTADLAGDAAHGMSIPWSAPEVFLDTPISNELSDIYSLGATVYTLLAGRSPFEVRGGSNKPLDLIQRIEKSPLQATSRPDVPPSLERALARCMARNPTSRFESAMDFARALQAVELELQLAPTPIDVPDELTHAREALPGQQGRAPSDTDDNATRVRGIINVPAQAPTPTTSARAGGPTAPVAEPSTVEVSGPQAGEEGANRARKFLPPNEAPASDTVLRPAPPASGEATEPPLPRRNRRLLLPALGVAVVAVLGIVLLALRPDPAVSPPVRATDQPAGSALVETVPAPTDLKAEGVSPGAARFTWKAPESQPGDIFLWRRTDPGNVTALATTTAPEVQLTGLSPGSRPCLEVFIRRSNGRISTNPATTCLAP